MMLPRYLLAPLAALLLLAAPRLAHAQTGGVRIGTAGTPDASAALDVSSTSKGLLPPRLSTAERDGIASPAAGLTIYNTSTNKLNTWNGTSWEAAISATEQPLNNGVTTFSYTGVEQLYTVPPGVRQLLVDVRGAEGGYYPNGAAGGKGARVQANLAVTPGQVLHVNVGGAGGPGGYEMAGPSFRGDAGWNGGGSGFSKPLSGGGGGGASDIRLGGNNLTDRVLVAGGGGGAGNYAGENGGSGGAPTGANGGGSSNGNGGVGGGLTAGGTYYGGLGQGGRSAGGGGGGGGGYYGGGGYSFTSGGGGGGSSLVSSSGGTLTASYQASNGSITLTVNPSYQSPALDGTNFVNVPGDNLGNHTATQNLNLGSNTLVGNGGTTGLRIAARGGVGIGADSPGYSLTVQSKLGYSGLLGFNTEAGADKYNFSLQNGGLSLNESGVASGRLFVQDGGSVGIGTTNPQATLDVAGGARLAGLAGTGLRMVTADANGALSTLGLPAGSQQLSISGSTISLTGGGSVTVPGTFDNLGNHTATQALNLAGFQLVSGGASGLAVSSTGNVGIGTPGPNEKLDVRGNAVVSGTASVGGLLTAGSATVSGKVGIGTSGPGHPLVVQADGSNRLLGFNDATGTDKYNFSRQAATTGTGAVPGGLSLSESNVAGGRLYVQDGTGNVGIGTTTPGQKLDVRGNATVSGSATVGGTATVSGNATVSGLLAAGSATVSGSVGIGTSSPATLLDVRSSDGAAITVGKTDATGGALYLGNFNYGLRRDYRGGNDVRLFTTNGSLFLSADGESGANRFVLQNGGSVGIGTSPAGGLHIDRPEVASTTALGVTIGGGTTGNPSIELRGNGKTPYIDFVEYLSADYTTRLRSTNGVLNVEGMGLSNALLLKVNGGVQATNVVYTSDARFKTNVRPLAGALASVLALRGVRYEWNALGIRHGGTTGAGQVGLIAQEVEAIYPELVSTDAQGYKAVNYAQLTPVLIEALKEQQQQIAALKAQNAAAHAELQTVKDQATATLDTFEARLRRLEAGGAQAQR